MKALVVLATVGILGLGPATANAEEIPTAASSELGQHVSFMATTGHPTEKAPGAFGQCVSTMATTGLCPEC